MWHKNDNIQSSCVLLPCCSHSQPVARVPPSVGSASPIGSASDAQPTATKFFELVIFVPPVCVFLFVFHHVEAHIPVYWRNVTAVTREKHLLYSVRSVESRAVSRAVWQFFKPNTRSLNGEALHSSLDRAQRDLVEDARRKRIDTKCAGNVSLLGVPQQPARQKESEGKSSSWHSLCGGVAPSAQLK